MSLRRAAAAYITLPRAVGWWFIAVTLIARIPATMGQLGSLLLVSSQFSSLGLGGATAALFAVGQAAGGPTLGRAADRIGHRRVGLAAAVAHTVFLTLMVAAVVKSAPIGWVLAATALAGATVPQVGPLSRARWTAVVRRGALPPNHLSTAMSFEGSSDEFAFVLGPALVGLLAAIWSPMTPVLVAAGLTGTMCIAFATHVTALPPQRPTRIYSEPPRLTPRTRRAVAVLGISLVALGCYFGSTQAGITARASDSGSEGLAGLIYAVLGLSSSLGGIAVPMLPAAFPLVRRLGVAFFLLAVLSLPMALVGSILRAPLWVLGLLVILPGAPIAPILITSYSLGEQIVPQRLISWTMTTLTSSVVIGYAIGALVSGQLAERVSGSAAFAAAIGAAVIGLAAAVSGVRTLTSARADARFVSA